MSRRDPYVAAAAALVVASGVTVRKYRSSNSGRAWTASDDWGIEAPRPHGPKSFAVFAHEVGHQVLHRAEYGRRPRWLEEIEAWEFALDCFARFELDGVEKAREDAALSLRWAAWKTARRCSAKTAQAILDRMPAWVWRIDDPREAVAWDVDGALRARAG